MAKKSFTQPENQKKEGHADAPKNLDKAKRFLENYKKNMYTGISVKIDENCIMFCIRYPKEVKKGNACTPVSFHQGTIDFEWALEKCASNYYAEATKFKYQYLKEQDDLEKLMREIYPVSERFRGIPE